MSQKILVIRLTIAAISATAPAPAPKALRRYLRFDLIRPMPVTLTSRLPGREKLQCNLHGETPVAHPWKADQSGTPVTPDAKGRRKILGIHTRRCLFLMMLNLLWRSGVSGSLALTWRTCHGGQD